MTEISGQCLCGSVSYKGDTDVKMVINCHCDDCRKATGSVYGTLLFVAENDIDISGETSEYKHTSDSGNVLTKIFCPKCGSQVFGRNSIREGVMVIRAGTVDQKDLVQPGINVYCSSAIPSTPVDPETKQFEKMPG